MNNRNYPLILGALFIALLVIVRLSGVGNFITFSYLQEQRLYMQSVVDSHYLWAVFAYIGIYTSVVVLALPLPALMTIIGGFLFGVLPAVAYATAGAMIGAIIFFLIVRYSFGKTLQKKYTVQLQWLNQKVEQYGTPYLVAVRLIAIIPFFVANILIGLTTVSLWRFFWTTLIGIIPGSLVYAFAGQQLTTINSVRDIVSSNVLIAFGLLAVLACVPIVVQHGGLGGK